MPQGSTCRTWKQRKRPATSDSIKRVFIIHKWGGTPGSDWYSWLKKELEKRGVSVCVPQMPDTDTPIIEYWLDYLGQEIGHPDPDTCLIGHSMGVQAILRYLSELKEGEKIGAALFVAGFIHIKEGVFSPDETAIIRPWIETPIDLEKAGRHSEKFVSIFSGNDPYIPIEDSKIFEKELKSKILIIPKGGHFTEAAGYKELHVALNELLKML